MKIKTYVADNVQEAFYKVKTEMGKDAIILQTKHIKKGGFLGLFAKTMVEVVAANDVNLATNQPQKPPNPLPDLLLKPRELTDQGNIKELKSEINEVKNMLNKMYTEQKQQNPKSNMDVPTALKEYLNRMNAMEVDEEIVYAIINNTKNVLAEEDLNNQEKVFETIKNEISSLINRTTPIQLKKERNIIAFVGPTGVGKTTTVAKLAANFSLYKNKRVAMITADTFRVGAIEQLKLYGDLLEIPVQVLYRPEDVNMILDDLKNYDLLLVDTMGFSPNNRMQIKKVKGMLDSLNPTDIHMVISAATKNKDMKETLSNYRELNYNNIIVTKLDETTSYGLILNALKTTGCGLSYLTTGQNVPDDIEVASAEKIADMILGEKAYV